MHTGRTQMMREERSRDELLLQQQLGFALRPRLDDILVKPLPENFMRLLQKLDVERPLCARLDQSAPADVAGSDRGSAPGASS